MTRDVRTPDGWRIYITFYNNVVSVAHRRKEQSLATVSEGESFWFEWTMIMMFNEDIGELKSANLKITDLGFTDKSTEVHKQKIKKDMGK